MVLSRNRAALLALLLVALWVGALLVPAPAADVIPPGRKGIGYGCEIANLAAYPDYLIIGLGINPALGPYQVLQAGNCDPFYKLSTVVYYAVRRDAFDPAAVSPFQSGGGTSSPQQAYLGVSYGSCHQPQSSDRTREEAVSRRPIRRAVRSEFAGRRAARRSADARWLTPGSGR